LELEEKRALIKKKTINGKPQSKLKATALLNKRTNKSLAKLE
jgi:hypothetical protein